MIAACDTFRAGAVEQLRTHVRHLNALHPPASGTGPPSVLLYEKGYGKDAASIAMDAINFGELTKVLISSTFFFLVNQLDRSGKLLRCLVRV